MTQYYDIKTYKQYDRDVKLAVRRGLDMGDHGDRFFITF